MARRTSAKAQRTPARKAKRQPVQKSEPRRIRKDLLREYQECMAADGVLAVRTLADDDCIANVRQHVSTLSLSLDRLLNRAGIPLGRITEIFGPPHIGKSTLLDHIFSSTQKQQGIAILAETESSRDREYTARLGVDLAKLQYLQFGREHMTVEQVMDSITETARWWVDKAPDTPVIIGWDALASTATRDEMGKRLIDGKQPGSAAKVMRSACRQVLPTLAGSLVGLVVLNHEYVKINMGGAFGGAVKRETYGGEGIRHAATLRVQLHPTTEYIKTADGRTLGRVIGARLVKNRLGLAWGDARIALLGGSGVNNIWSVYETFRAEGVITVNKSWATMVLDGETLKFQGWQGLQRKCEEDSELFAKLVSVYGGLP